MSYSRLMRLGGGAIFFCFLGVVVAVAIYLGKEHFELRGYKVQAGTWCITMSIILVLFKSI